MTTMLNRIWFRRCLAALLASEGAYILGLTILLGLIAPSAARFEGNEPNTIAVALAGGVGLTVVVIFVAAAVAIWRDAGLSTDRWLARATVLIAAAFHVMVAIGALLGLLGLALGRSEPGSVVISVAGWSATVAAGLAVAFALAATTRPTSQRAVGA
jgi:hypothetical protein